MEEKLRNKNLYKLELLFLKVLPIILAVFYFIGTVLSVNEDLEISFISYISSVSSIPLLFMYLSSYVFQFCEYHRMFLHYIAFNMVINAIDWYIGIPIDDKLFIQIYLIITGICLFVILYLYLKSRRNERFDNKPVGKTT